jgi:hypothetical protein
LFCIKCTTSQPPRAISIQLYIARMHNKEGTRLYVNVHSVSCYAAFCLTPRRDILLHANTLLGRDPNESSVCVPFFARNASQ